MAGYFETTADFWTTRVGKAEAKAEAEAKARADVASARQEAITACLRERDMLFLQERGVLRADDPDLLASIEQSRATRQRLVAACAKVARAAEATGEAQATGSEP